VAKLPQGYTDLLIELCEANVEFLLVGDRAVILYGCDRATDDLDIFVRPTSANSQRVFTALEGFGAPLRTHAVTPKHFAVEGAAYRFLIAPLRIEVLTRISGVSFDDALRGSKTFELHGRHIPYIGKPALIPNKKSAGCFKDLADVEDLEQLDDG